MKKLLFVTLLIALLTGCSSFQEQTHTVSLQGYDFTEFSKDGFMFTPLVYNGEYESIGLLKVVVKPTITNSLQVMAANQGVKFNSVNGYFIERLNPQSVHKAAKEEAEKMGADAITQLKIYTGPEVDIQIPKNRVLNELFTYYVSGFAIKRK